MSVQIDLITVAYRYFPATQHSSNWLAHLSRNYLEKALQWRPDQAEIKKSVRRDHGRLGKDLHSVCTGLHCIDQ